MRLHLLGTGTAIPTLRRGASGYALEAAGGATLLLECGPGSTRRLPHAGLRLTSVIGALVTHFHVDHCGDLPALLFARNVVEPAPEGPLRLLGPAGHRAHVQGLQAVYGAAVEDRRGLVTVDELRDGDRATVGPFEIEAREVAHVPGALGVRVRCDGRTLAFSGDSGECDALDALCRGADLALLECSYPAARPTRSHLSTHGAGRTAARAGVSRLALVHFYPSCDAVDREAEVRAGGYAGALHLGEDGDVLDV